MKPKMQLSSDVMVTPSFRAEMNAWMIDFFGYEEEAPQQTPPHYNDANLVAPKKVEKRLVKARKKTQVQPDTESFRALLEGLDDSFHTMRVPAISGSWLAKKDVNAIKKMGVYIPNPFGLEYSENPIIPASTPRASIASALFIPRKEDTESAIYPRFAFAIKAPKLPENVEVTKGIPYQFGQCYEMRHDESNKAMPPKLFWAWCWMVIRPDGSIRIPHEMRPANHTIRHKRSQGGERQCSFQTRHWALPTMAVAEIGRDQAIYEKMLMCTFRQLLLWWGRRKDQWSVGVRKDGHRATFSIAPEHTSSYFADRETVVNVDGKPRKIIHFVRAHTRSNGSEVKAHVRGLREFDWKGYHCAVTAPELKGSIFTVADLSPVYMDEADDRLISSDELASVLANAEDFVV